MVTNIAAFLFETYMRFLLRWHDRVVITNRRDPRLEPDSFCED